MVNDNLEFNVMRMNNMLLILIPDLHKYNNKKIQMQINRIK